MDWFTFGANTGKMRALPETPQNDAITVLLEGKRDSNEILNKISDFTDSYCGMRAQRIHLFITVNHIK